MPGDFVCIRPKPELGLKLGREFVSDLMISSVFHPQTALQSQPCVVDRLVDCLLAGLLGFLSGFLRLGELVRQSIVRHIVIPSIRDLVRQVFTFFATQLHYCDGDSPRNEHHRVRDERTPELGRQLGV